MNQSSMWQSLVPIIVLAVVVGLRVRRMSRVQPLRLSRLWIVPAVLAAGTIASFATRPPTGTGWLWAAGALLLGAAIGWQRGRLMTITVDPATGTLTNRASPVAIIVLVALILVRRLVDFGLVREGAAWAIDPALVTDASISFAFALLAMTRLEMFLRGRRLLAQNRFYA